MRWLGGLFRFQRMKPTVGDRVLRAAAVLLFLGVAAVCALVLRAFPRQDRLAAAREARLKTTEGTIASTEVRHFRRRRRADDWEVTVRYSFEADGRTFTGSGLDFSHTSRRLPTAAQAAALRARFPDGARVTVWYDAADPGDSALDPSWTPVGPLVPWAAGIGAFSLVAAVLLARHALRQARATPLPPAEVVRTLTRTRNVAAPLAGAAFLLLATHAAPIAFHALFVAPRLATATPIFFWELDVHNGPPTPVSRYRFQPAGRQDWVEGTAWRFGRTGLPTLAEAEATKARLVEAHQAGRLRVHYRPSDPARCALTGAHGGLFPRALLLCAAAVLVLAGSLAALAARAGTSGTKGGTQE